MSKPEPFKREHEEVVHQKFLQALKDPEGRRVFQKTTAILLPQLLVGLNLDEPYIRNSKRALSEFKKIWSVIGKRYMEDELITVRDFARDKNQLKKYLSTIDNKTFLYFGEIYLFYAVSIFEHSINRHFYDELSKARTFDVKTINTVILRRVTRLNERLGWFLELINGKNFIKEKPQLWGKIVKVIDLRNFLMHYKPENEKKHRRYTLDFDKNYLLEFLDNCSKCNRYLKSIRSDKVKNYYRRVDKVRKIAKARARILIKATASKT